MDTYAKLARKYLEDIIRFDTVNLPGNEQPLAEYISEILGKEGFNTEIQVIAPNRANVVAKLGNSDKKIILNGHLDVVPIGEGWTKEPFQVTEQNEMLYGRGTCDMKGAIASMMAAAIKLKREDKIKDCELILLFVADEEIDGQGTKFFAKNFEKGTRNWVLIGEPTANQVNVAHRGVVRLRIEVFGKQVHAAQPQLGINALTLMSKFLIAVDKRNLEKQEFVHSVLPAPTIAATVVNGGIKDNVVPGSCTTVLDFRTVPGDTAETLTREMDELLRETIAGEGISWKITPFIEVLPGLTEPDAEITKTAVKTYEKVYGEKPVVSHFSGCCDMSCFTANGFETIICGPGNLAQAHTLDEYLLIEQFEKSIHLYEQFVIESQNAK